MIPAQNDPQPWNDPQIDPINFRNGMNDGLSKMHNIN